jgi:hypothetical protein
MKFLILIFAFLISPPFLLGQYLDGPGALARYNESSAVRQARQKGAMTQIAYIETVPVYALDMLSRTNLNFNPYSNNTAMINYPDYKNVCNSYLNPFERRACSNKLKYLIHAHSQVLSLMQSSTQYRINKGVKELIEEKYTRITNRILIVLETMKIDSEKNWASLFIKTD